MTIESVYRMNKTAAVLAVFTWTAAAAFSFSAAAQGEDVSENYIQEQVHITVPGMEGSSRILWVSDMHVCCYPDDPDVNEDSRQALQERYEFLRDQDGVPSAENWKLLSSCIDSYDADYVVFGADMADYASEANLKALQEGMSKIQTPWMYIRADHDYARWYSSMGLKRMRKLHRQIAPQDPVKAVRFDDFTLVGLDNTTTAVSEETLQQFSGICEEGRPVILCMHVPLDQPDAREGDTLAAASRAAWDDRILCWGDGDEYDISSYSTMKQLYDIVCAPDSPVIAVLAGHLHLTWDGELTSSCREHVFSAAYEDYIGLITVSG